MIKKILAFMVMSVILFTFGMNVLAASSDDSYVALAVTNPYNASKVDPKLQNATKNVWATVIIIVRVLAVGAVVFAGLRYMFASSEQKADIKKGLMFLTIGAVLVFGATIVIDVVRKAGYEMIHTDNTPSSTWTNYVQQKQDEIMREKE